MMSSFVCSAMQVVYSGAVSSAADHFAGLGYRPSGPCYSLLNPICNSDTQGLHRSLT